MNIHCVCHVSKAFNGLIFISNVPLEKAILHVVHSLRYTYSFRLFLSFRKEKSTDTVNFHASVFKKVTDLFEKITSLLFFNFRCTTLEDFTLVLAQNVYIQGHFSTQTYRFLGSNSLEEEVEDRTIGIHPVRFPLY